jgi:hypothetical protein
VIRRILLLLSVAALMAAMLVASALPAFADRGGVRGHHTEEFAGPDCEEMTDCKVTTTDAGGDRFGGGRNTTTVTFEDQRATFVDTDTQGGSRVAGGGNCSGQTVFLSPDEAETTFGGSGKRCNPR